MSNYEQAQARREAIAARKACAAANYRATMKAIKAQLGDQVLAPASSAHYHSKAYEKAEKRAWAKYQKACAAADNEGETTQ